MISNNICGGRTHGIGAGITIFVLLLLVGEAGASGEVWTWGMNNAGQLGDGTQTQRSTPVQVIGLSGVTAIAGGSWHTIALKSDGTVWTWGGNNNNQLGDGTTTTRLTPVQVSELSGVTAIADGEAHTIALGGQLSTPTPTPTVTPVPTSSPSPTPTTMPPTSTPTLINSCTKISSPGEYVLNRNILDSSEINCINITSSNVVIDGAGYTIDGIDKRETFGVVVYNSTTVLTNVTVKNLKVTGWDYGIYYKNVQKSIIVNNNANSNNAGINLRSSSNNELSGNTANSNNDLGIIMAFSSNNKLSGNTANSNMDGINLGSSSSNTLSSNNASLNHQHGIVLDSSSNYNTLSGNTANSNAKYGIRLTFSSNNKLSGNTANSNYYAGILLWSSSNNTIYNNIFNHYVNFDFSGDNNNTWNTMRTSGLNIIGGSYLGGNVWANPSGKGFSQTCTDADNDGICDSTYVLDANNIDYLPLAYNLSVASTPIPTIVPTSTPTAISYQVTIEIFGSKFNPIEMRILKGTTVRWTNKDSSLHTINGDNFRSPPLNKRDTWDYTFYETGTYEYSCLSHPYMLHGKIIVAPDSIPANKPATTQTTISVEVKEINKTEEKHQESKVPATPGFTAMSFLIAGMLLSILIRKIK